MITASFAIGIVSNFSTMYGYNNESTISIEDPSIIEVELTKDDSFVSFNYNPTTNSVTNFESDSADLDDEVRTKLFPLFDIAQDAR